MLDVETEYRFQFLQNDKPVQVVALPESVMQLLVKMLDVIGQGNSVTLTPVQQEITAQQAADILNVSRSYLVQLLRKNEIPHRKVGTRSRVRLQDMLAYKESMYQKRLDTMNELTAYDQELGLQKRWSRPISNRQQSFWMPMRSIQRVCAIASSQLKNPPKSVAENLGSLEQQELHETTTILHLYSDFQHASHPIVTMITFNPHEKKTAIALFERMFPTTDSSPGSTQIGVSEYVDKALAGTYQADRELYRLGLAGLDQTALADFDRYFVDCEPHQQDHLISQLETGTLASFHIPDQKAFFSLVRSHLQEGLFADPIYGGNREKLGWQVLGHPGVWLENSAEENLSSEAVTKDGIIQSLADIDLGADQRQAKRIPGYDPQAGAKPPTDEVDVVLVGLGGVGGMIAPILTNAGLQVVALEAGPYRTTQDFLPDELGAAYYCRANMGSKFESETPRWRTDEGEPTQAATFSLGRMMNSVGGSVIHYGAWLRRFHPHHFHWASFVHDKWGKSVLPEGATLTDWPISYEDLAPYYTQIEKLVGVAGDDTNPFTPRTESLPMPPLRPFRMGEMFRQATSNMGLHPHPVPVGMNSIPYDGRPATTYTAWSNGFGSFNEAKWHPGLSTVPKALASGRLDLRTHCRVTRILTDEVGHACGVEYLGSNGEVYQQRARKVVLCSYTYENVRLLLLSGDHHHPDGLGNNNGQVGRNFMTKMFAHVDGHFPNTVFNRHTGPAAQGIVLDDFLSQDFDSVAHGFVGGGTLGAENQFLPIQISREALPEDVPTWGTGYKAHLQQWQHFGVVRIQPDTLSYTTNFIDLDPRHRDRSGLGLPVIRITYDMRKNEHDLANWLEGKSEEILTRMGASKTWRGARFTGVGSSHDLGGCRMGEDPAMSVVDANLQVHDTPGLYVFSGAAFPTCPGINPTLTLWAVCCRAAEQLVQA